MIGRETKMKTSELTGTALDWTVAKCEQIQGQNIREGFDGKLLVVDKYDFGAPAEYSTNWEQSGPIIEREKISLMYSTNNDWHVCKGFSPHRHWIASTPLIAAMRCYVASKLGDEVEIPEELK